VTPVSLDDVDVVGSPHLIDVWWCDSA
jgi:hypothetical protein